MKRKIFISAILLLLFIMVSLILFTKKNDFSEQDEVKKSNVQTLEKDFSKENYSSNKKEPKVEILYGDHEILDSIEEIEKRSENIIEGKFISKEVRDVYSESGHYLYSDTISKVEVKKSFKGNAKKGEIVTVVEPYFVDDETFQSIEGYNGMNKNGKYILFYFKGPSGNNIITGIYMGKYDLNIDSPVENLITSEDYSKIKNKEYFGEEAKKFNKIKNEVIKKYGK